MDLDWGYVDIPEPAPAGVVDMTFDGLLRAPLQVAEDGGAAGCGGKLWPAGDLLARYLLRRPALARGVVVELGSGTGLSGLALAAGAAEADAAAAATPSAAGGSGRIYITDQAQLVPLMARNVALNGLESRVEAAVLDWGAPLPAWAERPDLIIAADVVYLETAFPLLETTLLDMTAPSPAHTPPRVLMAYKRRRKADRHFFRAIRKHFAVVELDDFPEFERFHRESVFLFELVRKAPGAPPKPRGVLEESSAENPATA